MFKTNGNINVNKLKNSLVNVEHNYKIQANDHLFVMVYTNKGESIFDPNGELPFSSQGGSSNGGGGGNSGGGSSNNSANGGQTFNSVRSHPNEFLVQYNGIVKLPMVENVQVAGLTLFQLDSLLQVLYSKFYVDPFVRTRITNNRVFVLGANGGVVLQLQNDNMNLMEVLAQTGGIGPNAKAQNIRIIRNYLDKDPIVQVIDLSTIDGLRQATLYIEPNDVIYVEPNQRLFFEVIRDISPVVTTLLTLITTYYVITGK